MATNAELLTRTSPTLLSRFWKRLKKTYYCYICIAPAGLLILVFSYLAMVYSFYLTFRNHHLITGKSTFIGLGNFQKAFADPLVTVSFKNTAVYVFGYVPLLIVGSLLLALLGNQVKKGRAIFRTIYFIPTITPGVVTALLWIWVYEYNGVMNRVLDVFGIDGPNWLFSKQWAMPGIIIMSLWGSMGYQMIIFMAGLSDIPQVFYDAAKVDGANRWNTFWHITIPLLRNSLIFVVVTVTIGAFQTFTQAFIMTRGGPVNATRTVQLTIYDQGFKFMRMGYAAAISWMLFAVILVFSALQLKMFISKELY